MRAPRGGAVALGLLAGIGAVACTSSDTDTPPAQEETVVATDRAPAPRELDGLQVLAESDRDGFRLHTASGEKTLAADAAYDPGSRFAATTDASATERWIARTSSGTATG